MEYIIKYGLKIVLIIFSFIILAFSLKINGKRRNNLVLLAVDFLMVLACIFNLVRLILNIQTINIIMDIFEVVFIAYGVSILLIRFLGSINAKIRYEEVILSLNNDNNQIYLLLDNKERIREISNCLLTEFNVEKKAVLGKKLFDVINKRIRITMINNMPESNKTTKEKFISFKDEDKQDIKCEVHYQNAQGEEGLLNINIQKNIENKRYLGLTILGQRISQKTMMEIEKDLMNRSRDIESIQNKFVASIELMEEDLFFNDLKEHSIWTNNNFKKDLSLKTNVISSNEYQGYIHSDDIPYYLEKLYSLENGNDTYEVKYRFLVDGRYQYVFERGKRIKENQDDLIIGFVKKMDAGGFAYTGLSEIDHVKKEANLYSDIEALINQNHNFQLVSINLTNIPEINEQYGREVGNIIMNEYLKRLNDSFQTASSGLYRVSGLLFFLLITDSRKMEVLKRSILSNNDAMNLNLQLGSNRVMLKVNIGVSEFPIDAKTKEELLTKNKEALIRALDPNYQNNYVYYREIKSIRIGI